MTKPSLVGVLAGICFTATAISGSPGTPAVSSRGADVQGVAEREVARRQEQLQRAQSAIGLGKKAASEKDYETAFAQLRAACDLIPASPATADLRGEALSGFCDAGIKLAEQRIAEGRYQDAENIVKLILEPQYDPTCKAAVKLAAKLEDPSYFNKTITPKFIGDVELVKQHFVDAEGFYNSGRYDMAFKRYEQILNIDPYNVAARKGQEKVNLARSNYASQGYNEARSRGIWEVEKAWERPVKKYGGRDVTAITNDRTIKSTAAIENKLNRIIIPQISFRDTTVREAIDYLKVKSKELDVTEPDPAKRGVSIVLKLESVPFSGGGASSLQVPAPAIPGIDSAPVVPDASATAVSAVSPSDARITLELENLPLMEALRYITNLANLKFKIDPYAVAVVPISEPTDVLITKEYKVPPGFIGNAPAPDPASGLGAAQVGDATGAGRQITGRAQARAFLESQGVQFPPGATANFLPSSSRLVVRNTQENLDLIDTLVDAQVQVPTQVEIESKFVEITQNNLKELSFDWLLGQFNVGDGGVFAGGGTSGIGPAVDQANYPFSTRPGTPFQTYPLTSGNRTGNYGISSNAIDALLFPTTGVSQAAPGIFSIAGVFTDPTFQVVIRALNQKKGVDLLSAPRVTTKSGQRAVIEIIREFRYPTEFDPPQIPDTFGGSGSRSSVGGDAVMTVFPVTPTTPTAFETRNTGVTLEVEPVVGPDGYTIDLNLVPQVVEFEGFINYGSPIQTVNPAALGLGGVVAGLTGQSSSVVLTDNVINQPIFSTRKVTTSVSIWDGQTVVLGGLMREDVQKVDDKVPVLGDIPIVGRAFRSSIDQHIKRNLVIFVTARLMNPAGEPVVSEDEKEEVVEPLALPEASLGAPLPEAPLFSK